MSSHDALGQREFLDLNDSDVCKILKCLSSLIASCVEASMRILSQGGMSSATDFESIVEALEGATGEVDKIAPSSG